MERVKKEIRAVLTENLKEKILQAGNVTAFAKSIGVSRDSVNNWLSGKSDIRLNDLVSISKQYNISVDYLLGLSKYPTLNQDEKEAAAYTGLSAGAISTLHDLAIAFNGADKGLLKILSAIITDNGFRDFLFDCYRVYDAGYADNNHIGFSSREDHLRARLGTAMFSFADILRSGLEGIGDYRAFEAGWDEGWDEAESKEKQEGTVTDEQG